LFRERERAEKLQTHSSSAPRDGKTKAARRRAGGGPAAPGVTKA
jgi:hypothetical protein